ncbi:MAG TPA: ABC transporter permease [Rhizomicrobium sp.]|jgi:putative ABC transport system permease protein|nr:ABC transporter permease [Rhizomicrobium sp.]
MESVRHGAAVCNWNFRTIGTRTQSALIVVLSFFGVILVFVAVFSVRDGIVGQMTTDGADSVAIVYGDIRGALTTDALQVVEQAPGVQQSAQGPLVSATLFASMELPKWAPGLFAVAQLRGIDSKFSSIMPHFRIVQGRMFHTGLDEIIVGINDLKLFDEFRLGKTIHWRARDWKVVGIFATGSARYDSSAMADLHQIQSLNASGTRISSIFVKLTSPAAFPAFKAALQYDPRFRGSTETMKAYEAEIGQSLSTLLSTADGIITLLMAVGAVFGALNVMYANVANRSAEIATLRALGFARGAILLAVLSEGLALALLGGGLGVAAAYFLFDGYEASTSLGGTLTEFRFTVTLAAIGIGLLLTLSMGCMGGLFPAIRAARLPLARALRDA